MSEHPAARPATDVDWFQANGRMTGIFVIGLWVVFAVLCIAYGGPLALLGGLLVAAVLSYVTLVRPRVGTTSEELVYRRMLSDLRIPLAVIDEVKVTRYFQVTIADKRYVSPAVSRRRRRVRRGAIEARLGALGGPERVPADDYGAVVEDETRARIDAAKSDLADGGTAATIRRTWAPVEITVGVAAAVFLIVALIV